MQRSCSLAGRTYGDAARAWESFISTLTVKLLPIINNASLAEVIKLKLSRLLLGENGQPSLYASRMSEATSLDEPREQINRIWCTEDNIFAAYNHPLHETDDDFLYRQELKDLLRKHSLESLITNTIPASALKKNVSFYEEGGWIEKVMTSPPTVLHAKTPYETAMVKEERPDLRVPFPIGRPVWGEAIYVRISCARVH